MGLITLRILLSLRMVRSGFSKSRLTATVCFDRLVEEALMSEALTMRLIKQTTTIPLPTVYHSVRLQNPRNVPQSSQL